MELTHLADIWLRHDDRRQAEPIQRGGNEACQGHLQDIPNVMLKLRMIWTIFKRGNRGPLKERTSHYYAPVASATLERTIERPREAKERTESRLHAQDLSFYVFHSRSFTFFVTPPAFISTHVLSKKGSFEERVRKAYFCSTRCGGFHPLAMVQRKESQWVFTLSMKHLETKRFNFEANLMVGMGIKRRYIEKFSLQ